MRSKLKSILLCTLLICTCICNVACKNNEEVIEKKEYTVFSIEDTGLDASVKQFVKGTLYEGNEYFNEGIAINTEDRYDRAEIIDKYTSENAVYYKMKITDNNKEVYCMYRFQMSMDGKIESYIKYVLEA